jgi:hypothetical protein
MWLQGELIGTGCLGKVYIGMDPYRDLIMAVKRIESFKGRDQEKDMDRLRSFERLVERLRPLEHTNVVRYLCTWTVLPRMLHVCLLISRIDSFYVGR